MTGRASSRAPSVLFTGFLGSALLEAVLERGDGPVACLIQPQYRDPAEERAREIVSEVERGSGVERGAADGAAVRLYEGDITESDLGLGTAVDDPDPPTVPEFAAPLSDAAGRRTVSVPATKRLAKAATRLLSAASVAVEAAAIDYFDHPTRYRCANATAALAGTGVAVPAFESYADRLVAFARENPDLGGDPMT